MQPKKTRENCQTAIGLFIILGQPGSFMFARVVGLNDLSDGIGSLSFDFRGGGGKEQCS